MTCTANVCGTGGWTGPLPGDPDNNISLMAVPKYGAIEVSWTYPTTNSHAVAYFKVYRGINSVFEQAVEHQIVSGNFLMDRLDLTDRTRYYYWIRVVSTHGTEADPIGPASAVALPFADEILSAISGKITFDLLDADLRNGIERIDLFDRNLAKEILDRVAGNASLADALENVRSDTGEALTYALSRITQQTSDTEALATSVTALAAGLAEAKAAIVTEQTVRATEDEAMANEIEILYSGLEDNQAAILNEQTTRVNALGALATTVSGLSTQYQNNLTAIQNEQSARVNADTTLANSITSLQTQMGTNISALNSSISSIQTSLDGKASASQLNTLSTTVNGQTTTIQQNTTSINGILAKYTVKIDNNGYITGYGLLSSNNNGTPSSAFIIRADSFALVMPGYGNYTPFAVGPAGVVFNGNTVWNNVSGAGKPADNATVGATIGSNLSGKFTSSNIATYMDNAVIGTAQIADASVGTLKIAGNAVTVPASANGVYNATVNITIPQAGYITCISTFVQGTGKSGHTWRLNIGGQEIQAEWPQSATTGAMSGSRYMPAGTHTCFVSCDTWSGDGRCGITALGSMR